MKRMMTSAVIAATLLSPTWANAWYAWNRFEVNPIGNGVFEVVPRGGRRGATDYWCAAGDYAYRELRTPAVQRVYLYRAIGPSVTRPGRKAAQFSLTPPPGADTRPSITFSMKDVGDNLQAAAAQQYCYGVGEDDPIFRN